jgi:hypothetical protein
MFHEILFGQLNQIWKNEQYRLCRHLPERAESILGFSCGWSHSANAVSADGFSA